MYLKEKHIDDCDHDNKDYNDDHENSDNASNDNYKFMVIIYDGHKNTDNDNNDSFKVSNDNHHIMIMTRMMIIK